MINEWTKKLWELEEKWEKLSDAIYKLNAERSQVVKEIQRIREEIKIENE